MRQLKIKLVGVSAYMMNNPAAMSSKIGGSKRSIPTPEEEALKGCYWVDEEHSSLCIPSTHVMASFLRGASRYKVDKQSLIAILIGACHIEPELISLNTTDYKRDQRTVVIKKARVFKCRPKVMCPWEIEFEFHFDPEWLPLEVVRQTLPEVIKTAGNLIGMGDYRVDRKGPFGRYRLARLELMAQREEIPMPEPEIIGFDSFTVVQTNKKAAKKVSA